MLRFHSLLLLVVCSVTISSLTTSLLAQAAAKPAPTAAKVPQDQKLRDDVDDFWHYGKIERYDLAVEFGNKILSRSEPPAEILKAFQEIAKEHKDKLDDWMLRWQHSDNKAMSEVSRKIEQVLSKGR